MVDGLRQGIRQRRRDALDRAVDVGPSLLDRALPAEPDARESEQRAPLLALGANQCHVAAPSGRWAHVGAKTHLSGRHQMTVRLINTRDQTKSSTWSFVIWYAPAVNRWV